MRLLLVLLTFQVFLSSCAHGNAAASRASDFSLDSVEGKTVRLSEYLGRDVILLNFWATWCVPCQAELPALSTLADKWKGKGLTVLSVAMDGPETVSNVEPIVRRLKLSFPVLLDTETRVVSVYNPARDAPFSVLIAADGTVSEKVVGYAPGDEVRLESKLEALLAARRPAAPSP